MEREPFGVAGLAQPPLAPLRVGAHVLSDEERVRARLAHDPHGLLDHLALAHEERAAATAQRVVEVGEGVEQERHAVGGAEARQHRAVEHEQRDDAIGDGDGRGECRIVVDAQVAREEDDGGAHP